MNLTHLVIFNFWTGASESGAPVATPPLLMLLGVGE
jgi:hypothetical protein